MLKKFWTGSALVLALVACSEQPVTPRDDAITPAPLPPQSQQRQTPYAVGNITRFIHDESRSYDAVAGADTGIRTLITEIWYPVDWSAVRGDDHGYRRATYGDYVFGNEAVHKQMMTQTTFFHMTPESVREGIGEEQIDAAIDELFSRERGSFVEAPLAESATPLPVVVLSHGDAGSRYNMETVSEFLAAHGYLVIAPEHTGNSPYSMTGSDPALDEETGDPMFREKMAGVLELLDENGVYGSLDNYGQSYTPLTTDRSSPEFIRQLDASLLQRLNDLRATLAELDRMQDLGPFADRLALDRIGLTGRSFGGATTLVGLGLEPRFTAGFSVVPPGYPDVRPLMPDAALTDEESVLLSRDGMFPLGELTKPAFILSGAEDTLIIQLAAAAAEMTGGVLPNAEQPHPGLRRMYEQSPEPAFWGMLADSNHSTLGVSGTYWWPGLKPSTHGRTFEEGVMFDLVSAEVAHLMQREKVLAFFDVFIRGDESARDRLLDQSWADEGLLLESRNF